MKIAGIVFLAGLVAAAGLAARPSAQSRKPDHTVTEAQYERWKTELSNWGRWGKDDQIGALNLITPSKRKQAAGLVKEGVSVSLAGDVDTVKAVDNPNPYELTMLTIGTDRIGVNYHGIAHTHLDSLAHINVNGVFYNGYTPDPETVLKQGHARNSIHNVKNGIFTRGILIDIPRLKGVPYLEPGTPIYVDDLEAWEKKTGVKVSAGDALFVRTGVWARRKAVGPGFEAEPKAGSRRDSIHRSSHGSNSAISRFSGAITRSTWRLPRLRGRRSRLRVAVPRCAHVRQLRPRGARGCGCGAESMGVSADRGAAADSRRDRIAAQPDCDVLVHARRWRPRTSTAPSRASRSGSRRSTG